MSEKFKDILEEMRKDMPRVVDTKIILRNYADRIEAAAKALEADRDNWRDQAFAEASRANAATCKESLQVGNSAAMRESAKATMKFVESAIVNGKISVDEVSYEVLNKVHDFLGILIRENLIKEAPYLDEEPMLMVSDLADDLWEVIHKGLPCNIEKRTDSQGLSNMTKMREALEWFWNKRSMLDFCHNNLSTKTWEDWNKVYCFLREFTDKVQSALSAPARNCDRFKSEYDYDKLHEAFVKYCDSCDCPMGCIHRRDTRCMLDTRCGSILKCFAKFVLAE